MTFVVIDELCFFADETRDPVEVWAEPWQPNINFSNTHSTDIDSQWYEGGGYPPPLHNVSQIAQTTACGFAVRGMPLTRPVYNF